MVVVVAGGEAVVGVTVVIVSSVDDVHAAATRASTDRTARSQTESLMTWKGSSCTRYGVSPRYAVALHSPSQTGLQRVFVDYLYWVENVGGVEAEDS